MEFKVGMKVVCIDDLLIWFGSRNEKLPIKGSVYTIREVIVDYTGDTNLKLREIINAPQDYTEGFGECYFWANHFVPLLSDFKRITFSEVTELVEVGEN